MLKGFIILITNGISTLQLQPLVLAYLLEKKDEESGAAKALAEELKRLESLLGKTPFYDGKVN
jgi:hypothetical protein